ncbi:hypothetical protein JW921_05225 [Candidatus Fermentibacterales bacterium]|nr:hypothetical protein [Candidatus Fermentibacterales bacterium]
MLSLLLTGLLASTGPIMLADSLNPYYEAFVVLGTGSVLYVGDDGVLRVVEIDRPMQPLVFRTDWDPADWGWQPCAGIGLLETSPDGRHIVFTEQVAVPDSLLGQYDYVPGPVLVVVAGADGSGSCLVALSFDVGGGPGFDFLSDSRHIYGGPLLGCDPTPVAFLEMWSGSDQSRYYPEGYLIDISDGSRSGGREDFMGDGFYSNPWSDLVAAGCYPPNLIANAATAEVMVEDTSARSPAIIETWVLPDAGLARTNGSQVLRFADGRVLVNPGNPILVYGRLSDGTHVFSPDEGTTVLRGMIDWSDFSFETADTLAGLGGVLEQWRSLLEVPGAGFVFRRGSSLYFYAME